MDFSNSFTVTPMNMSVELKAGDISEGNIQIAIPADAKDNFHYVVSVSSYGVLGEDYKVDFLTETERTQIVDWITIDNPKGEIQPNKSVKVHYKVTVPDNAPAGGQYAAFLITSDPQYETTEGVAVSSVLEIASILYAEIDGELTHDGELLSNNVPGFVTSVPFEVSAGFRNDGNIHETARIQVTVKDVLGGDVIYPRGEDSGIIEEVIMPGTRRVVTRTISGTAPLGIYDVTQSITYMGKDNLAHSTMIICPIWFIGLLFVAIGIIAMAIVYRIKLIRNRRQVY